MESELQNLTDEFVSNFSDFQMTIYEMKGIDDELLSKLEQSMILLKDEYKNQNYIPKEVAGIFIDLYSAIEGMAHLYDEKDRQHILETADYLSSLARDICY